MIPDKIGADINLNPVKIELSLNRETMYFLAGLAVLGLVYGVKRLKR